MEKKKTHNEMREDKTRQDQASQDKRRQDKRIQFWSTVGKPEEFNLPSDGHEMYHLTMSYKWLIPERREIGKHTGKEKKCKTERDRKTGRNATRQTEIDIHTYIHTDRQTHLQTESGLTNREWPGQRKKWERNWSWWNRHNNNDHGETGMSFLLRRQDKTIQDTQRQEKTNKTRQDKTRQDITRKGITRQDKIRQDKTP
jgi:hypothetical protein